MEREKAKERIILGIDPGTVIMGYGIIKQVGQKLSLITLGVVKMGHLTDHGLKLQRIFKKTSALVQEYNPDFVALEAPFYGKNIQVMLKLGRAQGVAMAAALNYDIPIFEYSPKKIKQSVTGNGSASKEQVAAMLKTILGFKESPEFLDATDGLAVAVCHAFQQNTATTSSKSYSGWEAFAKDNEKRIR
ncbi:MAG: crossover junction endodeoxyribonuclease RuvC [Sphingobacterium sp.]|uniref:crossover junction endodeoxyribonuclease RuvC n=1 Tax=Sphingobacterium sp. JB170 TaxID=1434842 RepID=UPI00097EE654|nr:crossover junction endodeoxyribonuclease RuvC [Sphingobacterium sp. JB170]SJN50330.1 Crossover junction endodeoxyribonuclease RuvC [Sphingobacterium sp. JB170]